ncbi:MAG: T9SS type A sorting domain-containing protein [Chitinophagales bacterium]|nr:T9SS type A sorting domain-containing protein [Chitinophagales bacterium]MDW8418515.1 T9SS type A sorting domain-containing protein [Chitinophagales bacterium]
MGNNSLRFIAVLLAACVLNANAQTPLQYQLKVTPVSKSSVPAVHSGAFGIIDGHWFFIGGRTNGLHGFQPPFAFPQSGINDHIYFTDPNLDSTWSVDVYSLPDKIREPITSSNMQFYLHDTILYMIGGYGWKDGIQNFITWPTLTAIDMRGLLNAVKSQQPITPYFRQTSDSVLAVCGAHLMKLDTFYYLVFGHRFDGYYDRSDTTGFHVQEYTHEIRRFTIEDNGTTLKIKNYSAVRDTVNFRRRDYNLLHLYDPYRGHGLLAYSGVFRKGIDLPYFDCIEIYPDTVIIRHDFNQNLSQYHCAVAELYDTTTETQYHIFFGGMSMYDVDTVTQNTITDSLIPFVRTISMVSRDANEKYAEYNMGVRFPALLGTNAYFFPDAKIKYIHNHFIDLSNLPVGGRIGYITGGIESPEPNISITDPSLSFCSKRVFEVTLQKTVQVNAWEIPQNVLDYYCVPNPARDAVTIKFTLSNSAALQIDVWDVAGKPCIQIPRQTYAPGPHALSLQIGHLPAGVYAVSLNDGSLRKTLRIVKK